MSGEIEEGESYFGGVRGKKGAWGWKKDTCVFTSCYTLVTLQEGMLKCNRTSLYAGRQALLCQRVTVHNKGIFRA